MEKFLYGYILDAYVNSQHRWTFNPIQIWHIDLEFEVFLDIKQLHSCKGRCCSNNHQLALGIRRRLWKQS